jgi:hypothetical protein
VLRPSSLQTPSSSPPRPAASPPPATPTPLPTQTPAPSVSEPVQPTARPAVEAPAVEAPPIEPARPVRENDLVEFPDTPLEFVEQGSVSVSADLRRRLKRVLGKDTVNVRFFVRAEISIKGQVTRIDSVLKGSKDVPQLAKLLSPQELAELDEAFLQAAKDSRFKPMLKDGVKVRSIQTIFFQVRVP